jgi:hypothetical protein
MAVVERREQGPMKGVIFLPTQLAYARASDRQWLNSAVPACLGPWPQLFPN